MTGRQLRARVLLEEARVLGLDLADLIAADTSASVAFPTVRSYLEAIAPTFTPATAATYRPYWRRLVVHVGDHRLGEVSIVELNFVVEDAVAGAQRRRPGSTGRASRETCVAALRAVFRRAVDAGLVTANPAAALTKPRRVRSRRRALDDHELGELDRCRAHYQQRPRPRSPPGPVPPRVRRPPLRATVWLREKGGGEREQPVSPSLVALLEQHGEQRGAAGLDDPVLRAAHGAPLSARRYSTIFDQARICLDWADRTPVSAHVLRHTAITSIGRIAGYPVAQAFAGHTPPTVTGRHLHATLAEVASAVAALTGEAHPLADGRLLHRCCRR